MPATDTFTTPTGAFHIASHGNGWAYCVTDQSTGYDFWVQDEDAGNLQTATDGFTDESVLRDYMHVLGDESIDRE